MYIILAATTTPGNVNNVNILVPMLEGIGRRRFEFAGRLFHVDRGYNADYNYWMIFWMGMIPNIKQRRGATNRTAPNRRGAAKMFDQDEYRLRALVEGIFGAEESRGRQLRCRVRPDGQPPVVRQGRAIVWSVRALNRLERANILKVPIPSYGGRRARAHRA